MLTNPIIRARFISIILTGAVFANYFWFKNPTVGLIVGTIFLLHFGKKIGQKLFPGYDALFQLPFGILTFTAGASVLLWLAFYFYQINDLIFALTLIITVLTVELTSQQPIKATKKTINYWLIKIKNYFNLTIISPLILTYLILLAVNFYLLINRRTSEAIASPWHILPWHFFLVFFSATILLILIIRANRQPLLSLVLIILHTLQFSSVALLVYRIGYGFDPFIHLAAIKNILATGTLLPKTFYYIGEYSIIIFLVKLFNGGLELINQALLPFAFSILLPPTIYYALVAGRNWQPRQALLAALAALFLPVTYFINTTPQGLTNLLALMIIFLSFLYRAQKLAIQYLLFLALLAAAIHPLYGAPLILFVAYLFFREQSLTRPQKILGLIMGVIIAVSIFPLLFLFNALFNGFPVTFNLPATIALPELFALKKQFNFIFDSLYLYGFNYRLFFIILALIGFLISRQKRQNRDLLILAALTLFNFFVIKYFVTFEFVTAQNKLDYLDRMLELALYFLLPLFLYLIAALIEKPTARWTTSIFVILVLAASLTASLYFSYPVKDNYKNSHNFNVSQADIDTVQFINQQARGDYIVLANQMVGSAAIKEFGFRQYYQGNFYYSLPTSGANTYQYFNKMIFDQPTREYALNAMDAASVGQAYFVVNDYWTNSKKIIESAKKTADKWWNIASGRNFVFYYHR